MKAIITAALIALSPIAQADICRVAMAGAITGYDSHEAGTSKENLEILVLGIGAQKGAPQAIIDMLNLSAKTGGDMAAKGVREVDIYIGIYEACKEVTEEGDAI